MSKKFRVFTTNYLILSRFNDDEDEMEVNTILLSKICEYVSYNDIKFINKKFNKTYIKYLPINVIVNEKSIVSYNNWCRSNQPNIKHMIINNEDYIKTPTIQNFSLIHIHLAPLISRNLVSLILTFNIGNLINHLPNSLRSLHLDDNFNDEIYDYPTNLKELRFDFDNNDVYTNTNKYNIYIPESVEKLRLPNINQNSMTIYITGSTVNYNVKILDIGDEVTAFTFEVFKNMEILMLGKSYNHQINYFESNLSFIFMRSCQFNNSIYSFNTLKDLYLEGNCIRNKIDFPETLENLYLLCGYIFELNNLPPNLKLLSLGNYNNNLGYDDDFSYDLKAIPDSIETLMLDDLYNISEEPIVLPTSLKTFGYSYCDEEKYIMFKNHLDLRFINIMSDEKYINIESKCMCGIEYTYTNYEEIKWYK